MTIYQLWFSRIDKSSSIAAKPPKTSGSAVLDSSTSGSTKETSGVVLGSHSHRQQTENLKLKVLDVFVFLEGDIYEKFNYTKTVRALNPYYPKRDMIFTLRCTAGMIQLTYLIVNAITVTIDTIATTTFRSVPSHDDHHHCPHQRHHKGGKSMVS